MSMSSDPTNTMGGMSMPSSTSAMDMSSSSTSMMGMDAMAMTFFTSTTTPLFSMAWMPSSAGQYAGTCIFLIALATIFRALLAIRLNLFEFLGVVRHQRKEDAVYGYGSDNTPSIRPWRANEAVWIASMDVVIGGVGYLLYVCKTSKPNVSENTDTEKDDCGHDYECWLLYVDPWWYLFGKLDIRSVHESVSSALSSSSTTVCIRKRASMIRPKRVSRAMNWFKRQ